MARRSGATRYRRSWPQRLLLTTNLLAVTACIATAAVILYARDTVAGTRRTAILPENPGWVPADEVPPGDPMNILVIGTDNKDGLAADDPVLSNREEIGGLRPDAIMLVRLDPETSTAKILSFPRDLWLPIPGRGMDKINSAMAATGGRPDGLIQVLHDQFGITTNHYVEVNFAAFKKVIDVVGGVDLYISHPLRDGHALLDQPTVGCRHLDAGQALSYVRSRHLEWQSADGEWNPDLTGDHGRIKRQKDLLQRVLAQAIRKGAHNPATLDRLVRSLQASMTFDRDMTVQDVLDLGRAFDSFEAGELEVLELPVYDLRLPSTWTVQLYRDQAEPILDQFRGTDAVTAPEAEPRAEDVTLRVLNGGAPDQAAAAATDRLGDLGFRTQAPGTADPVERTQIRFAAEGAAAARLVARHLAVDAGLVLDPNASEVTLVLGPDHAGVLDAPRPADALPAATVAATSTTTATTRPAAPATTTPRTTTTLDEHGDPARGPSYVPTAVPAGVSC